MESLELVHQLKEAIHSDIKGLKDEINQEKSKANSLKEENEELCRNIKELKDDNSSMVKTLKELKEKYGRLHDKLKRKKEEINKKEKWWDRYRLTAETTMKKLRTLGTFSPDVLHEVSRDLVDIMEDDSSTETVSSQDDQTKKTLSLKKLSTTKDGKKKFRYEDVSPDQTDSKTRKNIEQQQGNNSKDENPTEAKTSLSQRSSSSSLSKSDENIPREIQNDVDNDETNVEGFGCPSLTSTPVFSSTQTTVSSHPIDFPDFSMIVKDSAPSNQLSKELRAPTNSKKRESSSSNFKNNLRIVIKDFNKVNQKNEQQPSCIRNVEKSKNFTNTQTNEEERSSPSILPQDVRPFSSLNTKQTQDKKRLFKNSSGTAEAKRQRMDTGQGCSVVLLSSDEEDNAKDGSSVDMFGEDERLLSKHHTNDKDSSHESTKHKIDDAVEKNSSAVASSSKIETDKEFKEKSESKSSEYLNNDFADDFPGFRKPDEPTYKNIEVIRKKDERLKLKGFSCRDCVEYYGSLNLNEEELKKRLKNCSRHRAKHSPPPSTPPGFWNLSFPETQEYMAKGMLRTEENAPQPPKRKPRRRRLLGKNRLGN